MKNILNKISIIILFNTSLMNMDCDCKKNYTIRFTLTVNISFQNPVAANVDAHTKLIIGKITQTGFMEKV